MAGNTILIAAGTATATKNFEISAGQVGQLLGFGFVAAAETISVLASYDGGDNYVDCFDMNGVQVLIGGSDAAVPKNPILVEGPGFFQVKRTGVTTDSIGVALTLTTIK